MKLIPTLLLMSATLLQSLRAADEDLLFAEIPMVYAASRREEPVSQAPASVTIITHDDIVKYGYRSIGQALASVAGVYLSDDGGYTVTIATRGIGVPGPTNLRTMFLMNGLPVVDKYWSSFISDLTPDMLEAIDHIEVIKGPGSAMFGSNALIMVINIVTRKGSSVNGLTLAADGGSPGTARGVFTYGTAVGKDGDLFLSGHYGVGERPQQELYSAFLTLKYKELALQAGYADRRKEISTGLFGSVVGDDRSGAHDSWYLADLRWEHVFDEKLSTVVRAYYQGYPSQSSYAFNFGGFEVIGSQHNLDQWTGYETQINWRPIERNLLTVGGVLEYHWTTLQAHSEDAAGNTIATAPGGANAFAYYAAYLQDEFKLLPALTLSAGVRFDSFPDSHRTSYSPRAAAVWSATTNTTVKLLFGQAFRAPSEFERVFPAQGGFGPENQKIASETMRSFELVVERQFENQLTARVSAFHNEINDLITVVNASPLIFGNRFDVETTGLEAELTKKFRNGVRGFVNGLWQHSDFDGGPAVNSPTWVANAGVIWPIIGDKLSLALRQNYVSERATFAAGKTTEAQYPTDLTLNSEDWIRHWSFNFAIQNAFNQSYRAPAASDSSTDAIPQKGRTILFRATYRF